MTAIQFVEQMLFAPLQMPEQDRKARMDISSIKGVYGFSQYSVTGDELYPEDGFQVARLHLVLHAALKGE